MERHKSFYYSLRRFHNWIKRKLIVKYLSKVDNLLDLASGKGGDLNKWIDAGIGHVEGYDIDIPSVIEAKRRLANTDTKATTVEYHVQDLSKHIITEYGNERFDAVTSMFAFHYFFESAASLMTILETLEHNLKEGGYFICCLFDGELVSEKLKRSFLTSNFTITEKASGDEPYGNRVGVLMKETVLDEEMDEFLVKSNDLIGILKWRGFEIVETKLFKDTYYEWEKEGNYMNKYNKEVSFLNRYYVFKRKFNLSQELDCIHKSIKQILS
jgi:mRNA (guanine-N7-)-methyltransferase